MSAPTVQLRHLFKVLNSWHKWLVPSTPVPNTILGFYSLFTKSRPLFRVEMKEYWNRKWVRFSHSCSVRITHQEDPVNQTRGLRGPDEEAAPPSPWERALVPGRPMRTELLTEVPRLEQRCSCIEELLPPAKVLSRPQESVWRSSFN